MRVAGTGLVNLFAVKSRTAFLIFRCIMKSLFGLAVSGLILSASAAIADYRVFIIANPPVGNGIDQCLAKGEKCGAGTARTYCQSKEFAEAKAYRRVDPDEVTGSVPKAPTESCPSGDCHEYVAIICQR